MYEWLRKARLATVFDCWHIDGRQKVYVAFQLVDFDIVPQNKELPTYKIYAKYPYWWILDIEDETQTISLFNALGYKNGDKLSFLLEKAWQMIMVNIVDNEYQWKQYPILAYEWHEPYTDSQTDVNLYERWTEVKTFKFTPETTKEDIKSLWFEAKVIKKSDEYKALEKVDVKQEEIDEVF